MIPLIYLFALLTTPADRWICDLWTRAITQEGMIAACGSLRLEGYRLDVYNLDMQFQCAKPAPYLMSILETCELDGLLDDYVLRLEEPGFTQIICMVQSEHEDKPSAEEIHSQCPWAKNYTIKFAGVKAPDERKSFTCPARNLQIGLNLYEQAPSADALFTDDQLTWLAGELIWNGQVKADCYGSGLDPYTLAANACGLAFARGPVILWQNQFNTEIYAAAIKYNVPAMLLKRMIMTESQFWPFYEREDAGELGLMQVTDNGLDTLLRFDTLIDPDYLNRDDLGKLWSRGVTRNSLICINCTMEEAIAKIKSSMDLYARLLAAFHCRAVTINPLLVGDLAWRQSVVDYNGSDQYLIRIEQ